MIKLLPCPFCGGHAESDSQQSFREFVSGKISNAVAVYCEQCTAEITVCIPDVPDITVEQVAEAWNRREPSDEITRLRAKVSELEKRAVGEWLPIETAPKTGRVVLIGYFNSHGKWRTMRGQYFSRNYIDENFEEPDECEEGWYEVSVEADDIPDCWLTNPTHWMPLPAAPGATPQSGETRAQIEAIHRAEVLAATIRELRDVVTHGAETKEDFIARVREILGADPDLRVAEIEAKALEEAAMVADTAASNATRTGGMHPEESDSRDRMFARAREAQYIAAEIRQLAAEKRKGKEIANG